MWRRARIETVCIGSVQAGMAHAPGPWSVSREFRDFTQRPFRSQPSVNKLSPNENKKGSLVYIRLKCSKILLNKKNNKTCRLKKKQLFINQTQFPAVTARVSGIFLIHSASDHDTDTYMSPNGAYLLSYFCRGDIAIWGLFLSPRTIPNWQTLERICATPLKLLNGAL